MLTLTKIQSELKAPKNQYNSFGKYNYRSAEDILEAIKPLLVKHDASMVTSDDIVEVGDRVYVKTTVSVKCKDGEATSIGFAREPLSKKGMDEAQITGSSASYSLKRALGHMFLIDDTKDPDSTNDHGQKSKPKTKASTKDEDLF